MVMTPVASAVWGEALVDGRAPTALAELEAQDRGAAAAPVVGEPAATLVPAALRPKTTSICRTTTAPVQLAVPPCRNRLRMK